MSLEFIRLQERKVRDVPHYSITVPKEFVKKLGWCKGDLLAVKLVEVEGKQGIFIYKPKIT